MIAHDDAGKQVVELQRVLSVLDGAHYKISNLLPLQPCGSQPGLIEIAIHPDERLASGDGVRRGKAISGQASVRMPSKKEGTAVGLPVWQTAARETHTKTEVPARRKSPYAGWKAVMAASKGRSTLSVFILVFATVSSAAPTCATCHPRETEAHSHTHMAHAMIPALGSAFSENLPNQPLHESDGGYLFTYTRSGNGLLVTAFRGLDTSEGLIEWVLGAGAQGQTPLVRSGNTVRESRVSYFPQLHQYGVTIGQNAGASPNAEAALGLKQKPHDLQSCLACHATRIGENFEPLVPGIQCERCHAGAEQHAQGHGMPFNPGKLSAAAQVQFCGVCHRVKPPVGDNEPENIRFQPLRLMKSRCFSSGRLACTTCHAAHEDARRNDNGYYNAKCKSCHDPSIIHADARKSGDCISCHMPKVQLHPALTFTDHYIRAAR